MTSQKASYLEDIRSLRMEIFRLLDGMDYCLDWKPDPDSWSAREVVYHLVETPEGGIHSLIRGMLSGQRREFNLTPDQSNMTPDRLVREPAQVNADIATLLDELEGTVAAASESDLGEARVMAHLLARGRSEERTADNLLKGLFARHWREHLEQVRELRDALGM